MSEWWLDIGAGMDAEHWSAIPCPPGVRRVAMDPLITSGMVESGRLAPLPPDIVRVGAEVRPPDSVEAGTQQSFLPFRSRAFTRVHCGFMLHLYLEVLDLLAEEVRRVLQPGGEFRVLLPHLGDVCSEQLLQYTESVLQQTFGNGRLARYEGPATSFWADLYQGRVYEMVVIRPG